MNNWVAAELVEVFYPRNYSTRMLSLPRRPPLSRSLCAMLKPTRCVTGYPHGKMSTIMWHCRSITGTGAWNSHLCPFLTWLCSQKATIIAWGWDLVVISIFTSFVDQHFFKLFVDLQDSVSLQCSCFCNNMLTFHAAGISRFDRRLELSSPRMMLFYHL